jgi:chitinase
MKQPDILNSPIDPSKTESLDGVDFNWEQPLNDGDFNMYYGLIRLTYQVFKKAGLLVSVALHKGMYMPSKMYQFVDRINLMTYDMDMTSGIYHADYDKVTTEVKAFISRNAPPEKLLMGIPMYARGKTKFAVSKTMGELVEEANNNSSIVVLESSMGDYQWDNPQKIDDKVAFAVEKGLSGVFFWELGQDLLNDKYGSGGILLTATDESAKKYIRAKKEKEEKSINDEL